MKKKFTEKTGKFSYLLKRACKFCSAPIHDKAHGASEFCPKTWDENGKVRDCKTAYHRENDKPEREIQAEYNGRNKAIKTRIEFLVKKHGDQVTTEMLAKVYCTMHGSDTLLLITIVKYISQWRGAKSYDRNIQFSFSQPAVLHGYV